MSKVVVSMIITVAGLAVVLMLQAFSTGASVVLTPSELLEKTADADGDLKRLQIAGKVTTDPISYRVEPHFELAFTISNPGKGVNGAASNGSTAAVPVLYNDIKPDMFAAGRDVIIQGDYINGVLRANNLVTQCPSKYEPAAPGPTRSATDKNTGY